MTIYAMERGFIDQLIEDRHQLWAVARSLGSAEAMRMAREELLSSLPVINITPKNDEELRQSYSVDDQGVAHIPIVGELTPHAKTDACGAYTAEALTEYGFIIAAVQAADADEYVESILFEINSPGGYVEGAFETADAIRAISKPTTSCVTKAASAAYLLASQTDSIKTLTLASQVGSVGVAAEERDETKALESKGITRRIYTSTEAPDKRPDTATEEGQRKIIAHLDEVHDVFVRYIAEGRKTSAAEVNQNFGRGGVLLSEKALAAGMIDEIQSVKKRELSGVASGLAGMTGDIPAAEAENEEGDMDSQSLKKEYPEVFAAIEKGGIETGVEKERARRNAINDIAKADPENEKLAALCSEAIENGIDPDEKAFSTRVSVAVRDGKGMAGENAPDFETSSPEDSEDGLTADEKATVKASLERVKNAQGVI